MTKDMTKYVCDECGWIYDPAKGVREFEVPPNTPFSELPDYFSCPECGASKDEFSPITELTNVT